MRKRIATIGFFDGVHLGHQCLIDQLKMLARTQGAEAVVVTMWPHPYAIVRPDSCPKLLTTREEKLALLRQCGADCVEMLQFDKAMSQLPAREFISQVLRDRLHTDTLLMGYDHHFGHGGGTKEEYMKWSGEAHMEMVCAKALPGLRVSSSDIRRSLDEGDVERAEQMLGRPYALEGLVVGGSQVGRTIGFPTANLQPAAEKLFPAGGVYAAWAWLPDGTRRKAILNIGTRPTLGPDGDRTLEAHLLHYSGNLYGQRLRVAFARRLRDERQFPSLSELRTQLERDARDADTLPETR